MSAVGKTHHVKINGQYYICAFSSKNGFQRTYQTPYVPRQSTSISRNEGEYGKFLVATQNDWSQGEGQLSMNDNGNSRFYFSESMDITGEQGGLYPLTYSEQIAYDGDGKPSLSLMGGHIRGDTLTNGLMIAYPTEINMYKFYARYDGTNWVQRNVSWSATPSSYTLTSPDSFYLDGMRVKVFNEGGSLPASSPQIVSGNYYYIRSSVPGSSFSLATTNSDSTRIWFTSTGSGTHYAANADFPFATPTGGANTLNYQIYDICSLGSSWFVSFGNATDNLTPDGWISKYMISGNNVWNNYPTDKHRFAKMVTDGTYLYAMSTYFSEVYGEYRTRFYQFPTGGSGSYTPTDLTLTLAGEVGDPKALAVHAGTVYGLVTIENIGSVLYKFDGTHFIKYKDLPDGFMGESLKSDGSILFIGGYFNDRMGGKQGQIYSISGSGSSETLSHVATFGNIDGTASNEGCEKMNTRGKRGMYFAWPDRAQLGVYDRITGGISGSYKQNVLSSADWVQVSVVAPHNGKLYYAVTDTANKTHIFKAPISTFGNYSAIRSSYYDFGLPMVEKLFTSITMVLGSSLVGSLNDMEIFYVKNSGTPISFVSSLKTDWDTYISSESSPGFYKLNIPLPDPGIKAHQLAYAITGFLNAADTPPVIKSVTLNAISLDRSPGKTRPTASYTIPLVIADSRTITGAIERGLTSTKLSNLRDAFENQNVVQMETIANVGTNYNVLITSLTELAANWSRKNQRYEATIQIQAIEI